MQVLLEILGQDASLSYDGEQGIRAARETSPDIVLCDLGLPGEISGFDVAKALRSDSGKPYLVAVTGYGGEAEKSRALASGFHLHLCKPIGADALEELFASIPR
jgi:CheY-like chemotaxis protein